MSGVVLKGQVNVVNSSVSQPPHYSSLINKTLCIEAQNVVVEEVIAEGGFGVIFLANANKHKYAVKRVVVNNDQDYHSVLNEILIMTSVDCVNVLKSVGHAIVCYGSSGCREIQNLMPLCKQNLLQLANSKMNKQTHFSEAELLRILLNVNNGLSFIHGIGMIHRDVKIENILTVDEHYVVSDFGSATSRVWDPAVDPVAAITEDLDRYTTLSYRSPEMVDLYGNRGPITTASDIWALGVCVYKLMSFKDPFETILAIQNRNLHWGKQTYGTVLTNIVECLLHEDAAARPKCSQVANFGDPAFVKDLFASLSSSKQPITHVHVDKITKPVVLETSVTPRQRPKRNNPPKSPNEPPYFAGVTATPSPVKGVSPAAPPPVKGVSPAAPPPPPAPPTCSWNPFDEDYKPPCDNDQDDSDDDPFAKAPFDYFKYQPIIPHEGASSLNNNPFYDPNSQQFNQEQ